MIMAGVWFPSFFTFFGCGSGLTLLYTDIDSGDSSFAFFSSSSLFNVEWRGSAIHIHGPDLWDNNSWDKFEMVIYHLNVAVYMSCNWFNYAHIVFVKVSWCSWNEEVESLYHQWSCNIHCLDGGSSHYSLKYIYVTFFVYLWSHSELPVRLSTYNLILASWTYLLRWSLCRLPEYFCSYTCFTMSTCTSIR